MSMAETRELVALREMNRLVEAAQLILAEYLPGKLTADEAIAELLELLDGPEQRDIQGRAKDVIRQVRYVDSGMPAVEALAKAMMKQKRVEKPE